MSEARHIQVSEANEGQRLDRWLKRELGAVPQSLIFKIIRTGQVRVDGKRAKADQKLAVGQDVRIPPVTIPDPVTDKYILTDKDRAFIKSLVIYDDGDLIALNKPGDIATQGGTNIRRHIDGLLEGLKNKKGIVPRLVHRLDRETSGVLLLARSAAAVRELGFMFKGKDIEKQYWALVSPAPEIYEGTVNAPLMKSTGKDKEKVVVDEEGQYAITDYQVVDTAGKKVAFIVFRPRTGRTHQIRAHAAHILKCPLIGDKKYGYDPEPFLAQNLAPRVHLHAAFLSFSHPLTKKKIELHAPLPHDIKKGWQEFGFQDKNISVEFKGKS
ncbi:MAG: RluA family pseudouridine synthase [Rhodospirillales bacterium]|nr:RluA family pseudouridine synthase [Rhodospirillales bacterium]MCB9965175.1 RluA family pseudouridine synthase [Rhodospirillales bacterium]MCB9973194.1 RluA family pseudouridine synthase [Rhodospirillales bacterium]MCB9979546.1 RluA family pseudouridine synthase [Rhodospirillales bacterium]